MQMLYDSDEYVVVWIDAHAADDAINAHNRGLPARHVFEIVHKKLNMTLCLEGPLAIVFQDTINAWQLNTPTQEEVEDTLGGLTALAQTPLLIH